MKYLGCRDRFDICYGGEIKECIYYSKATASARGLVAVTPIGVIRCFAGANAMSPKTSCVGCRPKRRRRKW